MYIFILPLFLKMAEPHRWGNAPINSAGGEIAHKVGISHAQDFYRHGGNSGYFNDNTVRSDKNHGTEYYKFTGPIRNDAIMKQAEQNIKVKWEQKKYNPLTHNCRQYKNAVNKEYGKLAREQGIAPRDGIIQRRF